MPIAVREHSLGPYPFDPNLVSQGIPPDDRVDFNDRIYAPVEGTPLPPGASSGRHATGSTAGCEVGAATTGFLGWVHRRVRRHPCRSRPDAVRATAAPPPPGNSLNGVPIPPAEGGAGPGWWCVPPPQARSAPTQLADRRSRSPTTTRTGATSPQGTMEQQTNLIAGGTSPKTWQDLMPT